MMKTLLLLTTTLALLTLQQEAAYARPDARQFDSSSSSSGDTTIITTTLKKKKNTDLRKREDRYADTIRNFNEQQNSSFAHDNANNNDFHIKFHQRQVEKRIRLDEMHAQVSKTLDAHHSGRKLLSDTELESHTRKQMALERKRTSLNEETSESYIQRMKRHEEKLSKKMERKERRREERFRKMMMDGAGGEGEL